MLEMLEYLETVSSWPHGEVETEQQVATLAWTGMFSFVMVTARSHWQIFNN